VVNKLLILAADAAKYTELVKSANLPQLEIRTAVDAVSAHTLVAGCNIVLGDPNLVSKVLPSADRLKWVQSSWAGIDHLCRTELRRDYILTNAKGMFGALIGEYVMAYVFALERQLFRMRKNQLERRWRPLGYRPAKDIRLGIVGLGSIGRELALTAAHFGIRVTGLNRSGRPCDAVEKVYTADDMDAFLAELDYVVLTLPATPQTRHFINAAALRLMKPSAVLINVGRGSSIIEADLVQALRDGVIGGAVLDVFENEPLAVDSPLWLMPNVFITPHTSAISFPEEIARVFIDNYQRFCRDEPLRYVVDFELGY
jgi:phosphoglycerate dehydrogenase-like enzyme